MKREARFVWIETYVRESQCGSVDVVTRDFVDDYVREFDPPCAVMPYGAPKCPQLGRDLGDMYRAGRLRRHRVGLGDMHSMGFPAWVWCYKLPDPAAPCEHLRTFSMPGANGSWCADCKTKIYDVETRVCGDCRHCRTLFSGSLCNKHLMAVSRDMKVTYKIAIGSCWTEKKLWTEKIP